MDTINADLWAQYGLTAMLMATRNIDFASPLHTVALALHLCMQQYWNNRTKLLEMLGVRLYLAAVVSTPDDTYSSSLWDTMARSPVKGKRRFGGTYFLHIQSRSIINATLLPSSCWFLIWYTLLYWRWTRYDPPKCRLTFNGLHAVMFLSVSLVPGNTSYWSGGINENSNAYAVSSLVRNNHLLSFYTNIYYPYAEETEKLQSKIWRSLVVDKQC
jgi:hypothetical protein